MRSLRTLLAGLLLAAGAVMALPGTAHACSCAAAGTKQYLAWADAVVWAEVDDVRTPALRGDTAHYLLDVERVYKGDVTERITVASAVSGATCGLEGIQADRRYVFFLQRAGDDGLTHDWDVAEGEWTANLCGGTGVVQREAIDRAVGTGRPAGEQRSGPAPEVGEPPRPGGPERLPLSGNAYAGMGVGALGAVVATLLIWRRQRSGAA